VSKTNIIEKPWGFENRWAINEKYLGKILHINRGHRLSLQYHKIKDETIYVLSGVLSLHLEHSVATLAEGESYRIRPGVVHRFEAPEGGTDVVLIEVSTPEIDDVVRLEDDYRRS
jgi:mannose-6-phosphate isomerase-like protein (cupin superfamily)